MLLSYAVNRGTQQMWDHFFSLCYAIWKLDERLRISEAGYTKGFARLST